MTDPVCRMAAVFDATASYGFQYFIFAEHVVIITSAIFARKWTRRYDSGVSVRFSALNSVSSSLTVGFQLASAMLIVLSPLLVLQTMLLLVMTIVHFDGDIRGTDYLDFYVSIPWRIAQAVVLWYACSPHVRIASQCSCPGKGVDLDVPHSPYSLGGGSN